jgi:hypothetical protein
MRTVTYKRLLAGLVPFTLFYLVLAHAESDNPHLIVKNQNQTACTSCHIDTPELKDDMPLLTKNHSVDRTAFKLDGVAMCSSCHNPNQGHKVGLAIDFPVPADMPLSENNDITCLTCHYSHGSLSSDTPQASFSFMDRLLNAARLHKSFLLRRNNSAGELCLTCHNPKGSK